MKQFLLAVLSLYWITLSAAEPEKCNLHEVQKPIQSSTGNVFILKDGKWQLAKK